MALLAEAPPDQHRASTARNLLALAIWVGKDVMWKDVSGPEFLKASALVVRDTDAVKKVASPVARHVLQLYHKLLSVAGDDDDILQLIKQVHLDLGAAKLGIQTHTSTAVEYDKLKHESFQNRLELLCEAVPPKELCQKPPN